MIRQFTFFLFLFPVLTASAQSGVLEERIKAVEEGFSKVKYSVVGAKPISLQDKMEYYRVKGLSIAVIKDYKVDWAKGYGFANVEEGRAVTVNTLFEPGSISKSLNGITLMKLVQDKKIDLKADINKNLKSWKFPYDSVSKGKTISLANLLSHTAGLTVHGFLGYRPGDVYPTIPQILDGIAPANSAPVRSYLEPGKLMEYSGGGTMISELLALDVSGKAYDQLVAETVFQPLGMQNSFFTQPPPPERIPQLATGYNGAGLPIPGKYPVLIEQAAGGLWTTPSDLAKFMIEVQLSAQGKSNRILSERTTQLMLKPYENPLTALGVFIEKPQGHPYFSHSAGNLGFSGKYMASLEDGNGVVVFLNSDAGGMLIEEVVQAVAQAYHWKGIYRDIPLEEVNAVKITEALQNEYLGTYQDGFAICTLSKDKDRTWFTASFNPWEAHFLNDTSFVNVESMTRKEFVRENGRVTGFHRMLDWKSQGFYKKIEVPLINSSELEKYTGNYKDKDNSDWQVNRYGDKYFLELFGTKNEMHFISPNSFYIIEDFGVVYEFVVNNGVVEMIKARSKNGENVIKRGL